MPTRKLERSEWASYFDRFTKEELRDKIPDFSRIEVLSSDLGAQFETNGERLLGLTYDPRDDSFEIELEGFVHRIRHPKEIYVAEDQRGLLTSLKVLVEKIDLKVHRGHEEVLTVSHALGHAGLLEAPRTR